ncbi:MAG: 16S rRNA (cytidine(1402)-2'-O)-methyltransferase [Patescibacteria group bacterium]|nr:16S rRNA (cytidine(1402)-2'-O)-methyltransferase [Patescibacteria group bacterium]
MATLYVIGTPIGNLEDITLRALKVLSDVDLVLCEDTRVTKRLLDRHGIKTPTMSYHAHSKLSKVEHIIGLLEEGKNLALVSDAGTPGVSDPGAELVARIADGHVSAQLLKSDDDCHHFAEAVKIEAVPGPSALTAAISVAGVPIIDGFTFLGFLPHKKGRETLFKEITAMKRPAVFYESPHRLMKTLGSLEKHLTCPVSAAAADLPKKVTICRELTKVFEEVVSGTAAEVAAHFTAHPDKVRGEFVVIVSEQ